MPSSRNIVAIDLGNSTGGAVDPEKVPDLFHPFSPTFFTLLEGLGSAAAVAHPLVGTVVETAGQAVMLGGLATGGYWLIFCGFR
jgi:transcriptional regulator GlxA family with amidase domain